MTMPTKLLAPFLAIVVAALCTTTAHAQTSVTAEELAAAREKVYEFEHPIAQKVSHDGRTPDNRLPAEHQNKIRKYFASLDSSVMKLAAIEMLDNRYVYIVTRQQAAELLGPLLHDTDPQVQARAARAMGYNSCGAKYAAELVKLLEGEPSTNMLVSVAYAMGTSEHMAFEPHLISMVGHADQKVRIAGGEALMRLDSPAAFEQNAKLLRDPEPIVRKVAVQNIAGLLDDRSVGLVERLLDDPHAEVRERAVWSLEKLNSSASAELIAKRLTDVDDHVRSRAAEVLGKLRATEHAQAVAALLHDDNVVVRRHAVIGLGHMGQQPDVALLRRLTNDDDEQVRELTAEAIEQIESGQAEE